MAINPKNIEELIESELKISKREARLFISIIDSGRINAIEISEMLNCSINEALSVAKSLIDMGMIIDISKAEYQSLHPRFAVVNRHRILCQQKNIPFKKNLKVDNIGTILEGRYNNARTK